MIVCEAVDERPYNNSCFSCVQHVGPRFSIYCRWCTIASIPIADYSVFDIIRVYNLIVIQITLLIFIDKHTKYYMQFVCIG